MNLETYMDALTLEEKAALLQGWSTWTTRNIDRLHIPAMFMSDGPHGLRKQAESGDHLGLGTSLPATCFPTAATMANSWDPGLGEKLGEALGEEAVSMGVGVVLGPGLNMKRSPLCGRCFEYFSEDPYLAGKMAAGYIRGIQKSGISACPKHFAVNSQETLRMHSDSVVDERTLRELYLTGFEIAVKEGKPHAIMSSYNRINGTYANENPHLLKEILREDWGFDGMVVTDWGGDNDHAAGVQAGSNLVMPGPGAALANSLVEDVQANRVSEEDLNARVRELLPVILSATEAVQKAPKTFDIDAHHTLARRCAAESLVLLENDGILPLNKKASVVLIGDFAGVPRYQGAGSSLVNPTRVSSLKEVMTQSGVNLMGYTQGFSRGNPAPQPDMIREGVSLAKLADVVLLCVGLDEIAESEGLDRESMTLTQGQIELMEAVCQANENVVLILSGGSPFVIPESCHYRAILHGYLGGQAGAEAMEDALYGRINPCGKLNESWPLGLEDTPVFGRFPGREKTAEYRESLYIGYRYYETAKVPVCYPFGYGLSYTTFAYSDLSVTQDAVTFTLTNTGDRDGAEIAQVYVSCPKGKVFRPVRELKGFSKVYLQAGESKTVTIPLDDKTFRYFNIKTNRYEVEGGEYEVSVAASVQDIKLTGTVVVTGTDAPLPYGSLPHYEAGDIRNVPDSEFETLLGRPIPDSRWDRSRPLELNDTIAQLQYAKGWVGRVFYRFAKWQVDSSIKKGKPDLDALFRFNMPIRAMGKMMNGMINMDMAEALLEIFDGHFFKGVGHLMGGFVRNQKVTKAFEKKLEEAGK